MQLEGREDKYQTWTQSSTFGDSRQGENGRNRLSNPSTPCFLIFVPISAHFIPCSHRWSSWARCIPNSFSYRASRSRAGFMQGPQSHTNLIRKEQNMWQAGSPGSPGSRRGRIFTRTEIIPIRIHQITTYSQQSYSFPALTIPNGLEYPFNW